MTLKYEKSKQSQGYANVIGCDEVGRGCLAGPVVAAAVMLPQVESSKLKVIKSAGIKDSKLLTSSKREELVSVIKQYFLWSVAEVSSEEVDEINIHNASLLAMKKAVEGLLARHCEEAGALAGRRGNLSQGQRLLRSDALARNDKVFLFVDGKFTVPNLSFSQEAIVGGDNKVLSIAAASIIAKVYRDELMQKFDKQYPKYNLAKHKGYATLHHRKMILVNGLSPIHRLTFCQNLAV
jgi:ribonuclease HII